MKLWYAKESILLTSNFFNNINSNYIYHEIDFLK
jgi:hypothetical protein